MEIEKTLAVSAPREQVWALLLDPQVMGGAVPGMQSIEVVSPTEYVAVMHQKISFISARFKLRTRIVEQRAPEYLRVEGTGEDTSVASSLKQRSEIFLNATPDGGTELRIKVDVDLLGRLGAFGLSVMKTKADRIWEEFGANLAARLEGGGGEPAAGEAVMQAPVPVVSAPASEPAREKVVQARNSPAPAPASELPSTAQDLRGRGWWGRLIGSLSGEGSAGAADTIHVELRRGDTTLSVQWPGARAEQCAAWLRDCLH
ncbi:MAG: SRPBCC family protein [Delftia acidovorans]|nr:SRPBCC family protein [Delftia acidovorans]